MSRTDCGNLAGLLYQILSDMYDNATIVTADNVSEMPDIDILGFSDTAPPKEK